MGRASETSALLQIVLFLYPPFFSISFAYPMAVFYLRSMLRVRKLDGLTFATFVPANFQSPTAFQRH